MEVTKNFEALYEGEKTEIFVAAAREAIEKFSGKPLEQADEVCRILISWGYFTK